MADYEDDFDDYKDDFEEPPAPAPKQPVAGPARVVATKAREDAPSIRLTGRIRVGGNPPTVPRPPVRAKTISSGARTQVSRLLDTDSFVELFAMAPASAFEQLQDKVRLGAWRHASAQAPDETRGIATQTEQLPCVAVGVQAPDDLGMASKLPGVSSTAAAVAASGPHYDTRVVDFLRTAGRAVEALCEANLAAEARNARQQRAARAQGPAPRPGTAPGIALGPITAVPLSGGPSLAPLLQGRAVQAVALGPLTPATRLVILGPLPPAATVAAGAQVAQPWASATVLLVLERQAHPAAVLVTYADVTAAAFSPDATMVVAGTAEGAVVLWDLLEPPWLHPTEFGSSRSGPSGDPQPLVWPGGLRAPSYSTHVQQQQQQQGSERAGGRAGGGAVSAVRAIVPAMHATAADPGWSDGGAEQPSAAEAASAPLAPPSAPGGAYRQQQSLRVVPMFGAGFGSLLLDDGGELAALSAPSSSEAASERGAADAGGGSSSSSSGGLSVGSGRTFQFLSLDDRGNVDVWFAIPLDIDTAALARGASLAGLVDLQDYGRSVGSAVKLMRAGGLAGVTQRGGAPGPNPAALLPLPGEAAVGPQAWSLSLCPSDSGRMLVGAEDGRVVQVTRTGTRPVPGAFSLTPSDPEQRLGVAAAAATSVAFHPSVASLFLAGFADGHVALFSTTHALPLLSWDAPWAGSRKRAAPPGSQELCQRSVCAVVRVAWVPGRQSAFIAVDSDGWLGTWDLLTSTATALACSQVLGGQGAGRPGSVTCVDVCGATALSKTAVTVLVATESSVVEVALKQDLFAPQPGEMRALRMLISRRHM